MTPEVRVYLAGRVAIDVAGEIVVDERDFRGRQGRLAFAYLVSRRERSVSRDEIARLLWPDAAPDAWDAGLSAILSRLQSLLTRPSLRSRGAALSRGYGQARIILPPDTWVDVEVAASAVDAAEGAFRSGDFRAAFGPATVAATIARRPFLADATGAWSEQQRERLRWQHLRALDCLGQVWLLNSEPALAVETAAEALAIDPLRESSYLVLMKAHAAMGNRARAVTTYHDLRRRLADEIGIDPTPEAEQVYLSLLT